MRLDAVIRRLAVEDGHKTGDDMSSQGVEELRAQLASQLDRIREKLVSRMPEQP